MRRSGELFRWGLTSLMLAPVSAVGWFAAGGRDEAVAFLWLALALVIAGGVLNALAVVRGVKGAVSGELMAELDGIIVPDTSAWPDAAGGTGADAPRAPRIILVDGTVVGESTGTPAMQPGPEVRRQRRLIGLSATSALLGLIALGAWAMSVEQPLAIAQGQLTLDEVYAVWSTASRLTFQVGLTIWIVASLAIALGVAVLALWPTIAADRYLVPRRMLALACVAGSVIVVAAWGPYFSVGNSLPDELPFPAGGVQSPASLVFGLTGVALSAAAILLTVPRWRARSR